jgi:hypothetical protein
MHLSQNPTFWIGAMTAIAGGKADLLVGASGRGLVAKSGHSQFIWKAAI